jgi:hypothetical protein
LTKLSAVDKYRLRDKDHTLERLLDLDGEIFGVGEGHFVKIEAMRIKPTDSKPHGIDYSLCLLSPGGKRLVCFDNAHPVATGRTPSKKLSSTNDHYHDQRGSRKPYAYSNAATLLDDFWTEVERVLKDKGIGQ